MIRFALPLLFAVLLFACETPVRNKETAGTQVDLFRENVLRIQRAGLLKDLSSKQLDSLITVYRKDTLNGLKEILVQSGDLLSLDLHFDSLRLPAQVYREASRRIETKYPELASDSVAISYLPEDPGGKDTGWMMIRLRVKDVVYANKLYYIKPSLLVDETFLKVYNTRLAAEQKDYRLYLVSFMCTDCLEPMNDGAVKTNINRFGVLKLTKAQAASIQPIEALAIDPEDEFTVMSPKEKAEVVRKFEATGLIGKQDSSWYRHRRDDILNNTIYGMEHVYNFLDTLFATASFDTINDYNPYEDILVRLSKISRGNFKPDGISDEPVNQTTRTVRFTLNGKVYEREMEQHEGILDPGILDDVNRAMEEQHFPGAFYTVLSRGNRCLVIYIDNDKVEKAKSSGFFEAFEKGVPQEIRNLYTSSPAL